MLRCLLQGVGWLLLLGVLVRCSTPEGSGPAVSIQPQGGGISAGALIRLTAERAAKIYYTLDETQPNPEFSLLYEAPFRLWSTTTIRFVAVDGEDRRGPEGKARFRVDSLFPRTRALPLGGNYRGVLSVTLQSDEKGQIRYTLDGSEPTLQSPVYREPLLLQDDTTLRYFGIDEAGNREPPQKQVYNFPPALTVTPPTGLFLQRPVAVEIKANDPDASIFYTVIERPQLGWIPYQKPLSFAHDTWLQIRAHDKQGWSAEVETYLYASMRPLSLTSLLPNTPAALAVAAVDLEGFDNPGLVMATRDTLYVVTSQQNTFQTPQKVANLSFVTAWIRSWDFDGDGLNDILLGDTQGKIHLFLATSGQTLQQDNTLLAVLSEHQIVSVTPLDFNGDGQLDLFVLDQREGKSRLVQRTPDGYKLQVPLLEGVEAGARGALAGDFNNDGKSDLLILPGLQRPPYILAGDGKGGFKKLPLKDFLPPRILPASIQWLHAARSDLDADGDLDLLLIGRAPPEDGKLARLYVALVHHLDGPYWKTVDVITLHDAPVRGCSLADFDSDGYPDLVVWLSDQQPALFNNVLGQRMFYVSQDKLPATLPTASVATIGHHKERGTHALLWLHKTGWQRLEPQEKPRFLHLLLQGFRGNRNAIGAQLRIETNTSPWLRELGIRSTGSDQSSLFLPIPFDNKALPQSIKIRWSDGQTRELPQTPLNQPTVVRPH